MTKYVRFGKLELWWCTKFRINYISGTGCKCILLQLGWVGITWLSEECVDNGI
jgi:hypothetical protein